MVRGRYAIAQRVTGIDNVPCVVSLSNRICPLPCIIRNCTITLQPTVCIITRCAGAPSLQSSEVPEEALVEESTLQNWRSPLHSLTRAASTATQPLPRCIVALGKFDAMHLGHRSLVERAAGMGGEPWLISFDGMATELGRPLPLQFSHILLDCFISLSLRACFLALHLKPVVCCLWTINTQESGPKENTLAFMLHICVLISHVCQDHAVHILMLVVRISQRASARGSEVISRMLCCRLDAETAIGRTAAASQSAVRLVSGLRRICAAPAHHPFCCRAPA